MANGQSEPGRTWQSLKTYGRIADCCVDIATRHKTIHAMLAKMRKAIQRKGLQAISTC